MTPEHFVTANTRPVRPPLVPELTLNLATEITPIWQATEAWLAERAMPPPFWAFAWPGGQAMARHILDNPQRVAGRRVLDFASGCGIAAIAAARAGAATIDANEIDPLAIAAIVLNARANGQEVVTVSGDIVGTQGHWDMILAGDVCYEAPMTRAVLPWLRRLAETAEVWVADPGRAYLPAGGMESFAAYDVPTTLELEDRTVRRTTLYRLRPVA